MNKLFHSVKLIEDKCRGCTKCMNKCPMEAVRLKNSKAFVYEDKCIDCGECIRTCPYNAHVAERNNIEEIKAFRIKIAIPSVTLYSQFGDYVSSSCINEAIKSLGFDEVFDITYACDISSEIARKEIEKIDKIEKPAISVFCPSIERLISSSFPSLSDHIVRVLTPMEIAASLIREKYNKYGYKDEEVGIFFLSPCVSWITILKYPTTNTKAKINGTIAICDVYSGLLKAVKEKSNSSSLAENMSYTGLSWSYPGGMSESINAKEYIAVDGVENVKRLFSDIEKDKLNDVDFIEAYACSGGCLGGVFLIDNPYNSRRITKKYYKYLNYTYGVYELSDDYRRKFAENIREMKTFKQNLANDFVSAVKKMKYMNEIINLLPGTDCGQCGSPSCRAFAEDVVKDLASLSECKMIDIKEVKDVKG